MAVGTLHDAHALAALALGGRVRAARPACGRHFHDQVERPADARPSLLSSACTTSSMPFSRDRDSAVAGSPTAVR